MIVNWQLHGMGWLDFASYICMQIKYLKHFKAKPCCIVGPTFAHPSQSQFWNFASDKWTKMDDVNEDNINGLALAAAAEFLTARQQ